MALEFAAAPVRDEIAVPDPVTKQLYMPRTWIDWITALTVRVESNPERLNTVELIEQQASIGTTSIPTDALAAGLYRVSFYARITQAATISSSLTLIIGWTDGGVSLSHTPTALTGNTVATAMGGSILIRSDQNAPITYATTYVSVGGVPMQYSLDLVVEAIAA